MSRADRCANPMRAIGEKGHIGKSLRLISSQLHAKFPFLPSTAKICSRCRTKALTFVQPSYSSPVTLNTKDTHRAEYHTLVSPTLVETRDFNADVVESSLRSGRLFHSDDIPDESDDQAAFYNAPMDEDTNSEQSDDDLSLSKCYRSSRELELEEMLDGLKEKFNDLQTYAERLQILTVLPQSWSARKIASEFGATRSIAMKAKILRQMKGVLASPTAKAGHSLPDETVENVRRFYLDNSRIMPGFKDKISIKINGEKKVEQKQMVLENLSDLHREFKSIHPEASIGISKFAELRPKQCVLAGASGTHAVCVCTYHQNCKLMLDTINISTLTKNSSCPIKDYKDCLTKLMCQNPTPACHLDECQNCPGIEPLSRELKRLLTSAVVESVEFRVWQSTDRCTLQTQKLEMNEFVDLLGDRLKALKPHDFIAKEQSAFVKNRKENLSEGEVLVHCDFSENYAFISQDAAQSFHYNNDQCTVHPVVYYYREGNDIHHRSLVVLSDSLTHDTAAVHLIQKILIPHVRKNYAVVNKIIYVTDGAAQHYKNRFQIANLMNHMADFGIAAEAHYHATAHGKGACDGVGAVFKREARRKSLQIVHGEPLLTPQALFRWSKNNFKGIDVFFFTKEEHVSIKADLKQRFDAAEAIPAIQKNHCFIPNHGGELMMKRFSAAVNGDIFTKKKQRKQRGGS